MRPSGTVDARSSSEARHRRERPQCNQFELWDAVAASVACSKPHAVPRSPILLVVMAEVGDSAARTAGYMITAYR